MPAGPIIRAGDLHIGHASPTNGGTPFHQTPYIPTQNKVIVNGAPAIRMATTVPGQFQVDNRVTPPIQLTIPVYTGDKTACGDAAVGGSLKVIIAGKGVHRVGDVTSGHLSWVPNTAAVSTNVKVISG